MKIGFLGFGNMAQAIVKGWVKTNTVAPDNIYASAAHYDKLQDNCNKYNIRPCIDNKTLVEQSDIIIIAIKPYQIESTIKPLLDDFKDKTVISIVAGWDFKKYEELGLNAHHISTIPNTPIAIGQGIIITEENHSFSEKEFSLFKILFEPIALIEVVSTKQLSIGGTLAGCTPAFTAMYLEALSDAGVKHGLSRQTAYRIAAKMLVGTGSLYLENKEHPGIMKDTVCSPSGTTIKGVASLEKNAFRGSVIEAIDAAEE